MHYKEGRNYPTGQLIQSVQLGAKSLEEIQQRQSFKNNLNPTGGL